MRVCVTGGTGFLGSAVIRALRRNGHEVVALSRPSSDSRALEELDGVLMMMAAFDAQSGLMRALEGCEGLCHVAGAAGRFYADPQEYERSNVCATKQVFAAARRAGVTRAVYTGTVAALYGLISDYADSKRRGATVAKREGGPGMDVVVVHPSGMIGPYDRKPTPLGRAIGLYAAGRQRAIVGGGSGYIHVDDAGAAHVAALERGVPGREYLLSAEYWTTRDLFGALSMIVGRAPPITIPISVSHAVATLVEPTWRSLGRIPPITTFTTSYLSLPATRHRDGTEDRASLGLPPYRPIPDALQDAVAWFQRNRQEKG